MIPGAPENKAIQPQVEAIYHYSLVQRLGFPQGARCNWCGSSFLPTNHERGVMQKRREWFTQHDHCEAKVTTQ
jgi:hypothetical protein